MSGAFFMNYTFKASVGGFYGRLEGQKIYSIDYFEEVEKLINDALKVLKTGAEAEVTFEHFGNTSTGLSRIYNGFDNKAKTVTWKRCGTTTESIVKDIQINKRDVKAFVLRAIELFRDKEQEVNAT